MSKWSAARGRGQLQRTGNGVVEGPSAALGPGGGERRFAKGARIHTENSYKHTLPGFTALLARAGLRTVGSWTDPRDWFAFFVAVPDGGSQAG